jgi:hypothetical protein
VYDPFSSHHIARAKQEAFLREAAEDRLARELARASPRRSLARLATTMIRSVFHASTRTATSQAAPRSAAAPD